MRDSKLLRLLALFAALGMLAAACSSDGSSTDDGDDGDTTTTEGETEEGEDEESSPDSTDDVELVQAGGRLAAVQEAGVIKCGVAENVPGFTTVDDAGEFAGFDVDFCRVVAAGILGDASAVEFVQLNAESRFTALSSGQIDLLIRNTTYTATRDGVEGVNFLFSTFYDGQGLMVNADSGLGTVEDLNGANICVQSGTTTELNLTAVFGAQGIAFEPVVFASNDELLPAYLNGECEVFTSDKSQLAGFKAEIEGDGGAEQLILAETISKEPLGPGVADGDDEWAQAVNWSVMATVQAEEFGITADNIGDADVSDPNIERFLGQSVTDDGNEFDAGLGLPGDFAVQIIEQVGSYVEIYERNINPIGLELRGVNSLWTEGGLLYVPPYR